MEKGISRTGIYNRFKRKEYLENEKKKSQKKKRET
jgi:hypothetical protein